jgi:diaminohydroxyphosphoribosylaminopyrimidine deaminase / 5-amino-6-(5-phosphoribosylamino)uracil reductase
MDDASRDLAWRVVQAAAGHADRLRHATHAAAFALTDDGGLCPTEADNIDAVVAWQPTLGWRAIIGPEDSRRAFLDLYLPICSATIDAPITVGHLGQSLDGFIATHSGESRFVTGQENILHLHRLRALCDAVVVGAGTVAAEDPQLTTRLVSGTNPLRVVLDPARRLSAQYRVFQDEEADTLYLCAQSLTRAGEERIGSATIVGIDDLIEGPGMIDVPAIVQVLRARGCHRIFVEGGGVTVSMFLEANLLDRLHVAIAPLIIGDGRPAIRLPARALLGDCRRPRYRVFRMGGDVLFDCELGVDPNGEIDGPVTRVI